MDRVDSFRFDFILFVVRCPPVRVKLRKSKHSEVMESESDEETIEFEIEVVSSASDCSLDRTMAPKGEPPSREVAIVDQEVISTDPNVPNDADKAETTATAATATTTTTTTTQSERQNSLNDPTIEPPKPESAEESTSGRRPVGSGECHESGEADATGDDQQIAGGIIIQEEVDEPASRLGVGAEKADDLGTGGSDRPESRVGDESGENQEPQQVYVGGEIPLANDDDFVRVEVAGDEEMSKEADCSVAISERAEPAEGVSGEDGSGPSGPVDGSSDLSGRPEVRADEEAKRGSRPSVDEQQVSNGAPAADDKCQLAPAGERRREVDWELVEEPVAHPEGWQQLEAVAPESVEPLEFLEVAETNKPLAGLEAGGGDEHGGAADGELRLDADKALDERMKQHDDDDDDDDGQQCDNEQPDNGQQQVEVGSTRVNISVELAPPQAECQLKLLPAQVTRLSLDLGGSMDRRLAGQRRHSVVSLDFEDDLEREFDEEPEFERRDISVKRNQDPRNEYELGAELGRGKFGTVYRCSERTSGRQLAAKFIHMRRQEDRQDVEREVAIMSLLQHKRLLQLYDAFDDGQLEMCLITELVEGGELFERIVDDDFELTEKKAAIFMRQICEGLAYMHSQSIVHLDMKPENILCLSRAGNRIKLIDFGLARKLEPNEALRVMFGTPDFAAPEVFTYETVSLQTDMWSVGVICYVLLSGLSPFMGNDDMETMANVTRATFDFNDSSFEPISDLAKDFISKLLLRDPQRRLTPGQCLAHVWLQRGGAQLEAAVRERRESVAANLNSRQAAEQVAALFSAMNATGATVMSPPSTTAASSADTTCSLVSLDKRNLRRYVVRRKWHKTVHAIMALGRMGANLRF